MERLAKRAGPMQKHTVTRDEAKRRLAAKGQHYKIEAVDLIPEGEEITFYSHGDWEDLCEDRTSTRSRARSRSSSCRWPVRIGAVTRNGR